MKLVFFLMGETKSDPVILMAVNADKAGLCQTVSTKQSRCRANCNAHQS